MRRVKYQLPHTRSCKKVEGLTTMPAMPAWQLAELEKEYLSIHRMYSNVLPLEMWGEHCCHAPFSTFYTRRLVRYHCLGGWRDLSAGAS